MVEPAKVMVPVVVSAVSPVEGAGVVSTAGLVQLTTIAITISKAKPSVKNFFKFFIFLL